MIAYALLAFIAVLIFYPALWIVLLALYVAVLIIFACTIFFCATWGWFERRTLERRWRAERAQQANGRGR